MGRLSNDAPLKTGSLNGDPNWVSYLGKTPCLEQQETAPSHGRPRLVVSCVVVRSTIHPGRWESRPLLLR